MLEKKSFEFDIFLNYASEDREHAQKLKTALEKTGLKVWFDRDSLEVGDTWKNRIKKDIKASKHFLILLSNIAISKTGMVQEEIDIALELLEEDRLHEKFIVPVKIEDCEPSRYVLRSIHTINLHPDWDDGFQKLIRKYIKSEGIVKENLQIVGLDLGHGETSLSLTNLASRDTPKALELLDGRKSIITAVGQKENGVAIGDDAYISRETKSFYIHFKSKEFLDDKFLAPMHLFIKELFNILERKGILKIEDKTFFFVGCPSGWTVDQRKEYEVVLGKMGIPNTKVMPESRAAFLFSRESGVLSDSFENLQDNVLIIDIGSSTTDFTLVKNLEESPVESGNIKLGGGLIDEEIFNHALAKYSHKDRIRMEKVFAEHPYLKSKCILKCRQVKEKYFSKSDDTYWKTEPVAENERLDSGLFFEIELYKKDMEQLLNLPIEALEGESWKSAFTKQLGMLRDEQPKLILMTGGASKMQFTLAATQSVFETSKVIVGADPGLSISKGLAIAGKLDIKIGHFIEESEIFIQSPTLYNLVFENFPLLIDKISDAITEKCVQIAKDKTLKWRNGKEGGSILALKKDIRKEMENVLSNSDDLFKEHITNWLLALNDEVERLTSNLCKKYDIQQGAVNLTGFDHDTGEIFDGINETSFTNIWSDIFEELAWVIGGIVLVVFNVFAGIFALLMVAGVLTERDNIPLLLRKAVPEDSIKRRIENRRPELKKKVEEKLRNELQNDKTVIRILAPIKTVLHESAEHASLLIR